jgi:hypothetical protein
MGCEVQVHEKTDSRGTWAYHCVDGWYLYTSPNHYRTHVCHIKETKSGRLSDTVHFKHKNITNPELTHADKIMKAIASLSSILKCKPSIANKHQEEIRELQQLMSSNPSFVKNDTRQEVDFRGCSSPTSHFRGCNSPTRQLRGCNKDQQPRPKFQHQLRGCKSH